MTDSAPDRVQAATPELSRPGNKKLRRSPFVIGGNSVQAGKRMRIELPIGNLMSGTPVAVPLVVSHGRSDGPIMWVSAAVHGDEIAGVEIIRRVHEELDPAALAGTLIAMPVVNVHGFNNGDRYLPDRRDLNRSFPGSPRGSLASRIAHLMMSEVVKRSDFGIDLHTGSAHRTNLPQIRANLDDPTTLNLASAFGAPVSIHSQTRDGSLRQAATDTGSTVLLYEGGEADRFDESAISVGTAGVQRVLQNQGLTDHAPTQVDQSQVSRKTRWTRAGRSGIIHMAGDLGDHVSVGQIIATIYDPFGKRLGSLKAPHDGIIIGRTQRPLVNRGDAVIHIAQIDNAQIDIAQIDNARIDNATLPLATLD